MRIDSIRFKKEEGSQWENGLLLDEGENGIIDKDGNELDMVYDYKRNSILNVDFDRLQELQLSQDVVKNTLLKNLVNILK